MVSESHLNTGSAYSSCTIDMTFKQNCMKIRVSYIRGYHVQQHTRARLKLILNLSYDFAKDFGNHVDVHRLVKLRN